MSDPNITEEEQRQLQALFDETATDAPQDQLNRLARYAAQIPEAMPQPWWSMKWLKQVLVIASVVAASMILITQFRPDARGPGPAPTIAMTKDSAPEKVVPDEEDVELFAILDAPDEEAVDPLASLELDDDSYPLDVFDVLFVPDDDANLEQLSEAYGAIMEL
jgi:hypothetical protein